MKISKLKYFILLLLVFLGILVFINVRETESEGMKAMLANPVANMQLTTAREIRRFQEDKDTVLGKPIYAEILIEYEPIGNNTKGDVYDEIIGIVKDSGWERDSYSAERDNYYSGTLKYESFRGGILNIDVGYKPDLSYVWVSIDAR